MRISKTGKGFKPLSLILSLAILFGCISAGFVFNVSAANDNFDDGCYLEEKYSDTDFGMCSNIWSAVTYKNKIDFTKGFYFRGDGKLDLATFSSEVEDGGDQRIVILDDKGKTYFIQAVPFEKDTETWYRFVASDASGEKIQGYEYRYDVFEKLNNKNETGTFDGGYLRYWLEYSGKSELSVPSDQSFTGNAFALSADSNKRDTLNFNGQGYAASTNTYNLTDGIEFKLTGLDNNWEDDYIRMGFSSDYIAIRSDSYYQSRGGKAFPLKFMNKNGKLAVSYLDTDGNYADWQELNMPISDNHTVKAVSDNGAYSFTVDGVQINGYSVSTDEFNKMNGNGGAYIGLYSQQSGAVVGDIAALPPIQKDFDRTQNGFVNFTTKSWIRTNSDYRVDLRKGITFRFPDGLSQKTTFIFTNNVLSSNEPYNISFKLSDGRFAVNDDQCYLNLDSSKYHTLWAESTAAGYEWYIDGAATGITIDGNEFNLINGYSNITNGFDGAYFKYYTDNGSVKISLSVLPGDLDCSGTVDETDMAIMRKYLLGMETEVIRANLYVNGDMEIDICDLVAMKR